MTKSTCEAQKRDFENVPVDVLGYIQAGLFRVKEDDPMYDKAKELIAAIDLEFLARTEISDGWTQGRQSVPRLLVKEGQIIGAARRLSTHAKDRKQVNIAEVASVPLVNTAGEPLEFHKIQMACDAVESEIHQQNNGSGTDG